MAKQIFLIFETNVTCTILVQPKATELRQKSQIYSKHLNNVLELIENDPDPYFFGSYNWYYTGGSLEILPLDENTDIMFHVSGQYSSNLSEFQNLMYEYCDELSNHILYCFFFSLQIFQC